MKKLLLTTLGVAVGLGAFSQVIVTTAPSQKNAVLEELTGKTCTFCPDGHKRAADLKAANPGRFIVLNIHTGGYAAGTPNYRSSWGDYVGGLYSVSGYPTGAVNRKDYGGGVMHNRGDWTANTATILTESSPVNTGGNATINLDTRQLTVDVEAYYTAAGAGTTNRMNVVIMQNNIAGPQTGGATFYPAQILPNGDYNHNHMVRHTLTPNAGDSITTISATSLYTKQYTYTIPTQINNIPVNLSDLEVAVYVSAGTSTGEIITGAYAPITFQTSTPLAAANAPATIDASLGAVCGTSTDASMQITNMGNTAISTATIEYVVNGGAPSTYQHTFTPALPTGLYEDVTIPNISGLTPSGAMSTINLSVTQLNGSANPGTNVSNGHTVSTAGITAVPDNISIEITTDRYGSETTWELFDETTNSVVASGGPYANLTANGVTVQPPVDATLVAGNCYRFEIKDSFGDGICCGFGDGGYRLKAYGSIYSGSSFGASDGGKFIADVTTSINESIGKNGISIFPNPTSDISTISFELTEITSVKMEVINSVGSVVLKNAAQTMNTGNQKVTIDGTELPNGIYFVNLTIGEDVITKKVSIIR